MDAPAPGAAPEDSGLKVGLLLVPVGLSALLQAAHFLRFGGCGMVAVSLALPFVLLARRGWAVRLVQVALVAGAASWGWTALGFMQERQLMGAPYLRMLLILGGVALFTLGSALVLEAGPLRRRLRRPSRR